MRHREGESGTTLAVGPYRRRKQRNRRESPCLDRPRSLASVAVFVAAHFESAVDIAPQGADDRAEDVVADNRQPFFGKEKRPRIRRLESRQIEQPFIDHRDRHRSRAASRHLHLDLEGLLRPQHGRRRDGNREPRRFLLDWDGNNAVESDRPVVGGLRVRLNRRHVDVCVGQHLSGDRYLDGG